MRTLAFTLLFLTACSPEPRTKEVQSLDMFERPDGQAFYCEFHAADAPERTEATYVFGTIFDDPQNRARITYGRELMMLLPAERPEGAIPQAGEHIYSVENYPAYDVRVTFEEGDTEFERVNYSGVVQFRRFRGDTPDVVAEREYSGSCGV